MLEGADVPFVCGVGEIKNFGLAHGQRDDESVRQIAEYGQQTSFPEVDQAGSVVDDDARH